MISITIDVVLIPLQKIGNVACVYLALIVIVINCATIDVSCVDVILICYKEDYAENTY